MTPGPRGGAAALICALLIPLPAFAHHSFAMFDENRTATIAGVVEEFQMINPHSWIQLMAMDSQGKQQTSLRPGDKVTVSIHPLKDGTNGGELLTVTLADGRVLNAHKAPGGSQ